MSSSLPKVSLNPLLSKSPRFGESVLIFLEIFLSSLLTGSMPPEPLCWQLCMGSEQCSLSISISFTKNSVWPDLHCHCADCLFWHESFESWDRVFASGPVAKTPSFHCRRHGSIPGWGTKILHAMQYARPPKKGESWDYKNISSLPSQLI